MPGQTRHADVQLYGSFDGIHSVANVCTQLALALATRFDVALHNRATGGIHTPALVALEGVDASAPVGIHYGFPTETPAGFDRHAIRIGGYVCETNRILSDWVDACNALDLVIVPSTFCRRAFRDSGVRTPVLVVPHGLEPEYRPVQGRRADRPFTFYNTFHESSHLVRKGVEELVRSFLAAFGPNGDRAVLRLRTQLSPQLADIRSRHDFGAAILLDPLRALSTAEFAAIYSEVHCTVHPSRGEGFGLVPLQSIACETPVIAPAATGMADYLDETNALCVRTAGRVGGHRAGNAAGTYFRIDEDHLAELMQRAYDGWETERARVAAAAPGIRRAYAWPRVLAEFLEVIEDALGAAERGAFRRRLAERCAGRETPPSDRVTPPPHPERAMSDAPKPSPDMEIIASDEGFVVHDADRNVVHYLNQTAAVVLSLCDGERSIEEIGALLQRQFDLAEPPHSDVAAAVATLREQGLLA